MTTLKQYLQAHKTTVIITLIVLIIIALAVGVFALFMPKKTSDPATPVAVTSDTTSETSSIEVSSIPVSSVDVVVPAIVESSEPVSSEPVSSMPTSSTPVSSEPVVNVAQNVSDKEETPVSKETPPPVSSEPAPTVSETTEDYAKPANRNMPSFTVDTSIIGASGNHHGEFNGTKYYHAGKNTWVETDTWFVFRFGQYPNATQADTDYLNKYQFSPFQEDGDYNPNKGSVGCYHCKYCGSWVKATFWEDGRHGSGRNHLANVAKQS